MQRLTALWAGAALGLLAAAPAAPAVAAPGPGASVDYGLISHAGLRRVGTAPGGLRLELQLGLKADVAGIRTALRRAASPTSPMYGDYLTLPALARRYGASSAVRHAVAGVFRRSGATARVDATHLRMIVKLPVAAARRIFGTPLGVYRTRAAGNLVALPDRTPSLPRGLAGNVDIVAGLRRPFRTPRASIASVGGTPTRTGTVAPSCLATTHPQVMDSSEGLFPNQLLTAYGIAPLQAAGLDGQGSRVAIVGEAPAPTRDVRAFRRCFGFTGTPLRLHGAAGLRPIIESSLDAMTVSMVAPRLAGFDLWAHPLADREDDQDVEGFLDMLAAPVEAAGSGRALPDVISVSYGECERDVAPFTAARKLVERQLAATAALGITVAVAAGDTGSSACAADVPPPALSAKERRPQTTWPATSPYVLAVGGTNLTLDATNAIIGSEPWNDSAYSPPYWRLAGGGGGRSRLFPRPWWQPPGGRTRTVPDVAAFADVNPGYAVFCSRRVLGCAGRGLAFVGGTSASTPLVAGMIALWAQAARERGLPRPGFIPPLLYALAARSPQAFVDITEGTNSLFGGRCCRAKPGYDLATGLGSPLADQVAALLGAPTLAG